jgi:16S rRNA (guanine1207-N2)-methyltransferase
VHQDALLSERALAANSARLGVGADPTSMFRNHPLGEQLLAGAKVVLLQLPRSLAELEEISWNVARYADPEVVLLAGGRDKHMSRGMNELLVHHFGEVSATRGWRKARVLTARSPRAAEALGSARFPEHAGDADLSFELFAHGATFGGATLDHGSRLLLRTLREQSPAGQPARIADIGCGNGVLAVSAALAWPAAHVLASDQSAAAVLATKLTASAAGVEDRVVVHRADATEAVADGWADLVLLNPPFHAGSTVHVGVGRRLISSCARVLAPGGELRLVFNSHLAYRPLIEREIGPTRQLARDRTFTVLAATRH